VTRDITFVRLPEIAPGEILAHMADPRIAAHLPLMTFEWDEAAVRSFVAAKEECWQRDGLGHWAILDEGRYVGWGGFQREGEEWDFGLVLKPGAFGLGICITRKCIGFAIADPRISFVTFLLPPSRTKRRALARLGARFIGPMDCQGTQFLKYRLETN
jgi:hypothetical protein